MKLNENKFSEEILYENGNYYEVSASSDDGNYIVFTTDEPVEDADKFSYTTEGDDFIDSCDHNTTIYVQSDKYVNDELVDTFAFDFNTADLWELNEDVENTNDIELEFNLDSDETIFLDNSAIATQISALIRDEWEAIDGYTSAIVSCQALPNSEQLIDVLNDILIEENVHVGQLEKILQQFAPSAGAIEDGEREAEVN